MSGAGNVAKNPQGAAHGLRVVVVNPMLLFC